MEKHIEILVDRKEYITKEEAYQAINEQYHETGLDGYQEGIELMNNIAKIPAADVVEVRHGMKINIFNVEDWVPWCKCSECGYDGLFLEDEYCSRCGVKLDGKGRGQDNT